MFLIIFIVKPYEVNYIHLCNTYNIPIKNAKAKLGTEFII